jgi:RND family efflux transporter MFP subunit
MKLIKQMAAVLICLLLAACNSKKDTDIQAIKPPVAVETVVAAPMDVVEGIEVTGNLEPKFWADVKTQIPGLIKQVYVSEWVRVRKGTPLARIDISETEALVKRGEAATESARAGQSQAQVALNRSEREQARMQKLKESGLATQQALDDARTEVEASRARIDAARAQIRVAEEELRQARARLAKGLVSSPIDGVVGMRNVNVGDLASDAAAGKPIFRIVDNRLLNLTVNVPSVDSARVKVGQQLEFTVDSFPGKTFLGKVMFVNPELSAGDRSLQVIAEVKNPEELLKGGLFAKGRIVTGRRSGVLQVPRNTVAGLDLAAKRGSLFVVANGASQKRDIQTGAVNGDMVEITTGLNAGEQYVVRGGFNLKNGDRVTQAGASFPATTSARRNQQK